MFTVKLKKHENLAKKIVFVVFKIVAKVLQNFITCLFQHVEDGDKSAVPLV